MLRLCRSVINSTGFSVAKKAARLAVYDATMIRQKNHHMPATMRVDIALHKRIHSSSSKKLLR
nr:unnamed protein product [Callosobruchus analis]